MYGFGELLLIILASSPWILATSVLHAEDEAYISEILSPVNEVLSVWNPRYSRDALATNNELFCEKPSVYICEEPPETVSPDEGKMCNYRNIQYHEQVYRWVAGRGCLLYTPDFLYVNGTNTINLNAGCFYGTWFAPCLEFVKEDGSCGCFPFDPGFEEVANVVRDALVTSAHGRWERCFYTASDCCSHVMTPHSNATGETKTSQNQCDPTFDGWTCWDTAQSDTVSSAVCSEFAYSNAGPTCHHFSYKQCFENGTWELQTDYSTCSVTPRLLRRYWMYIAVLAFSSVSCLPAVFIFIFYKRLRVTRVALHRNLLIAIVTRNILVIISRSMIYINEMTNSGDTVMSRNGLACRVLAVAERVAGNAVFVCMMMEGIYLHRLIVAVFRRKLKIMWLYGIGIVVAIIPATAWGIVMALMNNHSCWVVYTIEHVQWILDAPRIAILLFNTVLFIDIMRVLLTKIRNTENANQLNTVKATLFLMPLFGIQFLLTALRPSTTNCSWEQAYYYISYTVEGLQGFIVAMLYCYVNKEVHTLLKATYIKTKNALPSRLHCTSRPRISFEPNSDRRITYSTGIHSHNADDLKDQYASMKPKLHVAEIVSIQPSERLAEILDPVYETIDNCITNESYDYLDKSDVDADNDSGIIPNRDSKEDFYGSRKVSDTSLDLHDSPPNKNITLNEKNNKKNVDAPKSYDIDENINANIETIPGSDMNSSTPFKYEKNNAQIGEDNDASKDESSDTESEYADCENMLEELRQYIETNDHDVILNPELLAPNRKEEDKIVFV